MKIRNILLILIFFINLAFSVAIGQTVHYAVCYVHTIYSLNEEYYLKTIPFDNIEQTQIGKTTILNTNNEIIYEIPRYFEKSEGKKEIFLSNDGNTVVYINDTEFTHDNIENKSIEIYKNGKLFISYSLDELIDCDPEYEECYLTYKEAIEDIKWENEQIELVFKPDVTEFEKQISKKAIYIDDKNIYIFTKSVQTILIDLETGKITKNPIKEINLNNFKSIKTNFEEFKTPSIYGLPNLASGNSFKKAIAKHLGMIVYIDDNHRGRYKSYPLDIELIIDKQGNAYLDKIENYKKLPEDKIIEFINSSKFETTSIPNLTEKWRFQVYITLMQKNKRKAKKERRQELLDEEEAYKNRIIADTINGLYIPKNLEECFLELNKLLKPKDIETIKSLKDRNETIQYHLNFGMWLRNNWELWGGSRLQQYLIEKGIHHPDEMSSTILEYYYDWLNKQHTEWEEFEAKE